MIELVGSLRKRHGAKYSTLQYRLWAEMFINETHVGYTPTISAVWRRKATTCKLSFCAALIGLANFIAIALIPNQLQQSAAISCFAYQDCLTQEQVHGAAKKPD